MKYSSNNTKNIVMNLGIHYAFSSLAYMALPTYVQIYCTCMYTVLYWLYYGQELSLWPFISTVAAWR